MKSFIRPKLEFKPKYTFGWLESLRSFRAYPRKIKGLKYVEVFDGNKFHHIEKDGFIDIIVKKYGNKKLKKVV